MAEAIDKERLEAAAALNWPEIEAELHNPPWMDEYREQRFYPLKQVVDIFSSGEPEALTVELREKKDQLSELVDGVVEGYHNGFARSIQNFSLILQLFQDSKEQVVSLRRSIADGTRQLGAQSKTLGQQWYRCLSLKASVDLLEEIQAVIEIPAQVEAAAAGKDWMSAVDLLLDCCNRLVVGDLARVGALRKLQADMARLSRWIQDQMQEELQQRVYSSSTVTTMLPGQGKLPGSSLLPKGAAANNRKAAVAAGLRAVAARRSSSGGAAGPAGGFYGGAAGGPLGLRGGGGSGSGSGGVFGGAGGSFLDQMRSEASAVGMRLVTQGAARNPRGRFAAAAGAAGASGASAGGGGMEPGDGMRYDHAAATAAAARQLVVCLAHLDGVAEARAFFRYHSRGEIRRLIIRSLEDSAESAQVTLHTIVSAAPANRRKGSSDHATGAGAGPGTSLALPHAMEALAQRMVQSACDACLKALSNIGTVLSELADAPSGSGHTRTLSLLRELSDGGGGGGTEASWPSSPRGGGKEKPASVKPPSVERQEYIKAEYLYAWSQMQEEWALVMSELLGMSARSMGALAEAGQAPAKQVGLVSGIAGFVMGMADMAEMALGGHRDVLERQRQAEEAAAAAAAKRKAEASRLTFAFEVTVLGLAGAEQVGTAVDRKAQDSGRGYGRLIVKALGDRPGSPYLTPAVYVTMTSFAEAAASLVARAAKIAAPGGATAEGNTGTAGAAATVTAPSSSSSWGVRWVGMGGTAASQQLSSEQAALRWLLQQLESFVQSSFLPQTWVDLRARCSSGLVEAPEAFLPHHSATGVAATASAAATTSAKSRGGGGGGGVGAAKEGRSLPAGGGGSPPPGGAHAGGPGGGGVRGDAVLPAARLTERLLRDVRGWSDAMLNFEEAFLGLAENVLTKALETFTSAVTAAAGESRAWSLACRQDVALVMALEPDAPLLLLPPPGRGATAATEDDAPPAPLPFYMPPPPASGRPWDPTNFYETLDFQIDRPPLVPCHARWVGPKGGPQQSPGRGMGGGGLGAEAELQALLRKERPVPADQLLCGSGPLSSTARLVQLAALSEGLDNVAEAVWTLFGSRRGGGGGGGIGRGTEGMPTGIRTLMERFRVLSGACARTLRLELQLHVCLLMHPLGRASHVCEGEDAKEVHPSVGNLIRALGRMCEALLPHLRAGRAAYIVGGVAPAAARAAMWLVNDVQEFNVLGVERMVRTLAVLQPALCSLSPALAAASAAASSRLALDADGEVEEDEENVEGGDRDGGTTTATASGRDLWRQAVDAALESGGAGRESAGSLTEKWAVRTVRLYGHSRRYYRCLLNSQIEDVLKTAETVPMRYSYDEWVALLQVHVHRRLVTVGHMERLQLGLDEAYGLQPHNKLAEAFGNVVSAIQAPAELIGGTLSAAAGHVTGAIQTAGGALMAGGGAIVSGALLPAQQGLKQAFKKIQDKVAEPLLRRK